MQYHISAAIQEKILNGRALGVYDEFPDLELTEEETREALIAARNLKGWRLEQEARTLRRIEQEKELRRPWSAHELSEFIRLRAREVIGTDLVVDDHNRQVLNLLCYYFTNDPRFESEGYSLSKGILLVGPPGTGKSLLMQLFSRNKRQSYDVLYCADIADWFADNGNHVIQNFSNIRMQPCNDPTWFYQDKIGAYFDDIGAEDTSKVSYGNRANVMERILTNRHKAKAAGRFDFTFTHGSSNHNADQLKEAYGARLADRMIESFNIIELLGPSRRI